MFYLGAADFSGVNLRCAPGDKWRLTELNMMCFNFSDSFHHKINSLKQ